MIKYLYCSKKEVKTGEAAYPLPKKDELLLLLIINPSKKTIKKVADDFSLDSRTIKNYTKDNYSKRISLKPFQFVFVDYSLYRGKIVKNRYLFIMGKRFLIIFSQEGKHYSAFLNLIAEEVRYDMDKRRISYLLYRLLEEDIEENYGILRVLEQRIYKVEDKVTGPTAIRPNEIIFLKRDLFRLNKAFWASTKIIFSIKNGLIPIVLDQKDQLILEDIYHTLQHQIDVVFSQKEMLTDLLEIYVSNISNNLNKVMKTLTALTVIVAVPTLITGIYGMNFKYIPLAEPMNGFYLMLIIIATTVLMFSYYFYKKDWL